MLEKPGLEVKKQPEGDRYNKAEFLDQKFKAIESSLGIKKEDLDSVEGFKNLSEGQKALFADNFLKYSFTAVEELAFSKFEEGRTKSSILGKISRSVFQKGYYEKSKTQAIQEFSQKKEE